MYSASVSDRLEKLSSQGIKPGLSRVARLLNRLDNPQHKTKVIQIVGTNGKGSTAKTLYTVLLESGYSAALYTSPHLVNFEERLMLGWNISSPSQWHEVLDKIEIAIAKDKVLAEFPPTFFEIATVAAILIIVSQDVEVAVIEAGMGGRFDATSIFTNVICSVICQIGIDHSQYLGYTLDAIASEKMAIIRSGSLAIYFGQEQLNSLFSDIVNLHKTIGKIFSKEVRISDVECSLERTKFTLQIGSRVPCVYATPLLGTFAAENVAFAIFIAKYLMKVLPKISQEAIKNAVESVTWAGRFEIISRMPLVILDGGHNQHALEKVGTTLSQLCANKITIVIAMMKDKDVKSALSCLIQLNADFIATEVPENIRSMKSNEIASCATAVGLNVVRQLSNPIEALAVAIKRGNPVVILGSLFLVGYIKARLRCMNEIIKNST